MAYIDYLPAHLAIDPATAAPMENAIFTAYAADDIEHTTPLEMAEYPDGTPLVEIVSGPNGFIEAMIPPAGVRAVVLVSDDIVNEPISTIYGPTFTIVGDPATGVEGDAPFVNADGEFELAQGVRGVGTNRMHVLTQAEFDALGEEGRDPLTVYLVPDEE